MTRGDYDEPRVPRTTHKPSSGGANRPGREMSGRSSTWGDDDGAVGVQDTPKPWVVAQSGGQGDAYAQLTSACVRQGRVASGSPRAVQGGTRSGSGNASAQFNLGLSYRDGRGLPQNDSEALRWLTVALRRLSGVDRKKCVEVRDALAKKLSPSQVAEANKLAREWIDAFERLKPTR